MKRSTKLMLAAPVGAAALALAACGDNDANKVDEAVDANVMDANMAAAGSEADLQVDTLRIEVDRLRQTGAANMSGTTGAAGTTGAEGGNAISGGTGTDGTADMGGGTGTGTAAGGNATTGGTGTGSTGTGTGSFAAADLDGDGRLTPAEFAVRELESVKAGEKAPGTNDETRPYVSNEALNRIVDDFRRLDTDGDFRLSEAELGAAG